MKTTFTQRILLAVFLMAGYGQVWADVGQVFTMQTKEGVAMTFVITSEVDKTCQVGEDGYYASFDACIDHSVTGTVTVPATVLGYTVTKVAEYAFQYCSVSEVVIPKSVSVNSYGVFYCCKNLKKFYLEDGINRVPKIFFDGCESLTEVYIPASVTRIEDYAFKGCKKLQDLQIPENVTAIGDGVFKDMVFCKFTFLPAEVPYFGSDCFTGMSYHSNDDSSWFDSNFYFRNEEQKNAYVAELKKQDFLSDKDLPYVFNSFYQVIDREAAGYLMACIPNYETNEISVEYFKEYPGSDVTELTIPNYVKGLTVTKVGNLFFYSGNANIQKVVLPPTIKTIGENAFDNFSALTDINLPEGLEAVCSQSFQHCSSLKQIEFPSTLKELEKGAFRSCDALATVIMNASNVRLATGTYDSPSNCKHAIMLVPFGSLKHYGTDEWLAEFTWRSVMEAKDGDIFPAEFKSGQDMWFQVICADKKTCRVYGNVESSIPAIDKTLEGAVNIPQKPEGFTVEEIGTQAFCDCSMSLVNIPNTVKHIGEAAFALSQNLLSVVVPASVEEIGPNAFAFTFNLASVTLNEGLKKIGDGAFWQCYELYNVTLPSTLNELGKAAFRLCSGLTSINIPDGIKKIEDFTFQSCSNLTSIDLPVSVSSLGANCFQYCDLLQDVKIRNSHVALLDEDGNETDDNYAFDYFDYHWRELKIPEGSYDYYGQAPWTTWFGAMVSSLPYVATGIGQVEKSVEVPALWYSLDGKPMLSAPTKPGLYIRNGKKVVVK